MKYGGWLTFIPRPRTTDYLLFYDLKWSFHCRRHLVAVALVQRVQYIHRCILNHQPLIPPQTLETLFKAEMDQTPEKLRAFYARYFADPRPELYERDVELASRVLRSGEYPRWAKASALAYLMIYEQPVRHEFPLLNPPVLLIVGEKDRTVVMRQYGDPEVVKTMGQYPDLARAAARDIPDCRLVVVPATGHVPHLESPDAFHRALLSFLEP